MLRLRGWGSPGSGFFVLSSVAVLGNLLLSRGLSGGRCVLLCASWAVGQGRVYIFGRRVKMK
jgi:hypothetical protein